LKVSKGNPHQTAHAKWLICRFNSQNTGISSGIPVSVFNSSEALKAEAKNPADISAAIEKLFLN
jgi:hypothetical protein